MTHAEQQALLIHYPSGGFGHFIYGLLASCTNGVFCQPDSHLSFSDNGDSHALPLSVAKWMKFEPDFEFVVSDWAKNSHLRHILLVDSAITNGDFAPLRARFPENKVVRLCIDYEAVPIIHQTCESKAHGKTIEDQHSSIPWEQREMISLRYHFADRNPTEFYLRNFKPVIDEFTLNLPISWIAYNFDLLLDSLEEFLGESIDRITANTLHQKFLVYNQKYFMGPIWAKRILDSLRDGSNINLSECTSLYDQGYVNYRIEREFNLEEIPPYTYQNWFKDTDSIRSMLGIKK